MGTLLIIMHIIVSIALIMIVLLQTGKGADMGAAFGGGASQTLFGSTGASTFLDKATTVVAVLFMLPSWALAYRSGLRTGDSIMVDKKAPIEQQATPAIPAAPDQGVQPAAEDAPPLQPAQAGKGTQK